MQKKGIYESTKKTLNLLERIYKYAIAREYAEHNIIADFDKKIVLKKKTVRHHPTITDDKTIKLLLNAINNYQGEIVTKYALKIIPYLALRPIELRSMKWEYINFKDNIIVIPADKMKMRGDHIVPITSTVMQFLKELQEHTGDKAYLFPNVIYKDRYMSENTINTALRRMGFTKDEIVSHGFRSMFSTIAHEKSDFKHEVIETQLAHSIGNSVSQAYNRAKYLDERVELMQWWSNYLDEVQK
jgi:integrase